jgi:type I restriction enzyme M protein
MNSQTDWIANFIWGIADDVLRDIYVRGKYRDVILPMTVIRRLDAVLEPTKEEVLKMKKQLDEAGITNQEAALCQVSKEAFYNTSPFRLRDLTARGKQQQLKADFETYLDGFSKNVQEILEKFKFRNQLDTLLEAEILGSLIEKFVDPSINLSPKEVNGIQGLDNHAMGTIFEELIRKFNEENNEEAGEHFTPRDVVNLMAKSIFMPIKKEIESGTYLLYDGACGTGGMLTVAEETLLSIAKDLNKEVSIHLFGQEINPETYAISKADLILKGEGSEAENIKFGSTLSSDGFISKEFDFMLSNPPYGKSWKTDLERMGGKKEFKDSRFIIEHGEDSEYKMLTRSSDGQLMFLVNKLSKMKHKTKIGSRIAHVHNGSSLFTGDAGQGESNIRRWIVENDWLEAIIALPENIFYNTGIATYIWVLTNNKKPERKGKVQLIDASGWFEPLRKNLGKKNCIINEEQIDHICDLLVNFKETEKSKIFPNEALGYWKITVERPLRLKSQFTFKNVEALKYGKEEPELRKKLIAQFGNKLFTDFKSVSKGIDEYLSEHEIELTDAQKKKLFDQKSWEKDKRVYEAAKTAFEIIGEEIFIDHEVFKQKLDKVFKNKDIKLEKTDLKAIIDAVSWRDSEAKPIIKSKKKNGEVDYEPDSELRDTEQVPLLEEGGIKAFFEREVLPYAPDAWIDESKTQIGYEISFTRHFYKPIILRRLEEITKDIRALEEESEGLLEAIISEGVSK